MIVTMRQEVIFKQKNVVSTIATFQMDAHLYGIFFFFFTRLQLDINIFDCTAKIDQIIFFKNSLCFFSIKMKIAFDEGQL